MTINRSIKKRLKQRRFVAAHEAGHLVVAVAKDIFCYAEIWKTPSGDLCGRVRMDEYPLGEVAVAAGIGVFIVEHGRGFDLRNDSKNGFAELIRFIGDEKRWEPSAEDKLWLPYDEMELAMTIKMAARVFRKHRYKDLFWWAYDELRAGRVITERVVDEFQRGRSGSSKIHRSR